MGCFLLQGTSPNSKRIKEYKGLGMFTGARAGRYPRVRPGTKGQTECDPCTQWSAASLREEGNSDTCSNTDGPRGRKVMRFHFCVVTGAVRLIGEKADGAGARAGGEGQPVFSGDTVSALRNDSSVDGCGDGCPSVTGLGATRLYT